MTQIDSTPTGSAKSLSSSSPTVDELNEAKLVAWVNEKYQDMKSARIKQEMVWYVNMSFYYGNQYVEYIPRVSKLFTPKAPPYRVRHVSNRIRPIVRTEIARLTSQKPSASVIPASADDEDLMAAQAAEQVWESLSNKNKLQTHFRNAIWWTVLTGNGFIKVWWDKSKIDPESGPEAVPGDICFGHVNPFQLYVPDLREVDIQEQPYVLNVYAKPLEWVKKFFGPLLEGKTIQPDAVGSTEILNDAYLNLGNTDVPRSPDSVVCKEMWIKDGGCEFLQGDWVVQVVGEHVVSISPFYAHGKYPFIHFGHIPSGTFNRTSVIEDLIPLQKEYNRTRSQLIENKNRMARLQMRYALGSVDVSKVTNEPGQWIPYRPGLPPPEPLPLQPVPNYVTDELQRSITDMEDISGQHEVSRGSVPPGVTAATAISYLQEKDDSLLSHTFANVEEGMEEIASQTLSLVSEYWDTTHMIKVVGEDGFFDTLMLKGSDLKGNTDIRMEGGSSLPTSKAAKQALIMDMMKMGFIQPNDGLKILEIGGVQKLYDRLKRDESQAQRENIRMKSLTEQQIQEAKDAWNAQQEQELMVAQQSMMQPQMDSATGQPMQDPMMQQQQPEQNFETLDQDGAPMAFPGVLPVNTWDNHEVHIEVHNNYRKSQAFELLPKATRDAFELHVNMHLAAAFSAMQEAQMVAGGGMAPGMEEQGAPPGEEPPPEESGPPMGGM